MINEIKKLIEDKIREIGISEKHNNDFATEQITLLDKIDSYNKAFMLIYCGVNKDDSMIITVRFKKDNEYLDEIPESFDNVEIIVMSI